jgi:uncharacterized membrane protein
MKPLLVLLVTFVLAVAISKFATGGWDIIFSGNLSMAIMMCFSSLGHFMFPNGMTMMIPSFIPMKKLMVYLTGILEIILGIALLFPSWRFTSGIILLVFFVLTLSANINAAMKHVDFEKATYEGKGVGYLWFRIPLQLLFIAWVYVFAVSNLYIHP